MKSVNMDWIPGSKFLDEPPLPIAKVIDYMSNDSVLDAKSTRDQMEILPAVEDNSRHLEPFILHPHNILPGASSLRWTFNMGNYSSWRFQRNKDWKTLGNKFEGENSDGLRKRTDCTSGFSTYGEQTCAIPVKIGDREIGVYPIELRISAEPMRGNSVEECGIEPDSSSYETPEEIGVKKIGNKYPIVLLRRLNFLSDSSVQLNTPEEETNEKLEEIEVRKIGNKYPIVLLRRLNLPTEPMREDSVDECGIVTASSSYKISEKIGVKKIGNKYPIVLLKRLKFTTDSSVQLSTPEEQTHEKPEEIEVRKIGNKYPIVLLRRLKFPTDAHLCEDSEDLEIKKRKERERKKIENNKYPIVLLTRLEFQISKGLLITKNELLEMIITLETLFLSNNVIRDVSVEKVKTKPDLSTKVYSSKEQTLKIGEQVTGRGNLIVLLRRLSDESLQHKDGASPKMERKRRSEDSFSENVLNENITNTNENLIGPSKKNKSSKHTKVKNKREPASNPVIDDEVESIFRKPSTKSRKRTLYSPCTFEKSRDMAILFSDVIDESIREFGRLSHSWIETPSLI